MVHYDPTIIHHHAARLYDRASNIVALYGVFGALLGVMASLPAIAMLDLPGMSALGFALLGLLFGVVAGNERAFVYRLQAQTALCQAQIEANTRPSVPSQSVAGHPQYPAYGSGAPPPVQPAVQPPGGGWRP